MTVPAASPPLSPPPTHTLSEGECETTLRPWARPPLDPEARALPTSGKLTEVSVTEVGARLFPWSRTPPPRPRADSASTTRTWSASSAADADNHRTRLILPGGRRNHVGPISRPLLPRQATPPHRTNSATPSPPHVPRICRLLTMHQTFLGCAHSPYNAPGVSGWHTLTVTGDNFRLTDQLGLITARRRALLLLAPSRLLSLSRRRASAAVARPWTWRPWPVALGRRA